MWVTPIAPLLSYRNRARQWPRDCFASATAAFSSNMVAATVLGPVAAPPTFSKPCRSEVSHGRTLACSLNHHWAKAPSSRRRLLVQIMMAEFLSQNIFDVQINFLEFTFFPISSGATKHGDSYMTKKEVEQWLALRDEAGLKIDPETAEVSWKHASALDAYGIYPDLPRDYEQIRPAFFARSPGSDIWVHFRDLPHETREALWERHKTELALSAGHTAVEEERERINEFIQGDDFLRSVYGVIGNFNSVDLDTLDLLLSEHHVELAELASDGTMFSEKQCATLMGLHGSMSEAEWERVTIRLLGDDCASYPARFRDVMRRWLLIRAHSLRAKIEARERRRVSLH
jgi:hypothetical protein